MTAIKSCFAALAIAVLIGTFADPAPAQQNPASQAASQSVAINGDDIGGTVTSRFGPEAGVWVIAETQDLGTRFAKMAVTDERGRYVIPDLPKAGYKVWVRGYGLVDSPKVPAEPGKLLDLTAVIAPSLADAAQYYPAIYWAAMIKVPDRSRFPGTGDNGNGIPEAFKTQDQWLNTVKTNGCGNCHQLGNYATRTISEKLGHFESSQEAWMQRLSVGPAGHDMVATITRLMTPDGGHLAALADWTDRIEAGELPSRSPPRPAGVERNLVVTVRDWSDPKHYLHDLPPPTGASRPSTPMARSMARPSSAPTICRWPIRSTTRNGSCTCRSATPTRRRARLWRTRSLVRRPIGAWSRCGTARSTPTTR
jgi:hypothetical protein